jgi:hypothetical protein
LDALIKRWAKKIKTMKKTTRLIAAITVLLLISGIIVFQAKVLDDSKAMSARLGRENAKMTERWIINATCLESSLSNIT